jgi:hypothetical protein
MPARSLIADRLPPGGVSIDVVGTRSEVGSKRPGLSDLFHQLVSTFRHFHLLQGEPREPIGIERSFDCLAP